MRTLLALTFILLLSACDNNQAEETATTPEEKKTQFILLALGDSLTEGLGVKEQNNYPSILQRKLPNAVTVINAGLSGETTSGLKNRLNWVLQQKPQLTLLNIGANDAMRGLPLELTKANLDEIILTIKNADSDVILAGMQIYDNLGKEYVTGFSAIYSELAQKHNIPLIPFFLAGVAGNPKLNQNDMIHPNFEGYKIIVDQNIMPFVQTYLQKHSL